MFLLNGQPLPLDIAFTDANGVQRPANWLRLSTLEEKAEAGITEVPDPIRHDDRFFWDHNIPKDLTQLKADWSRRVNEIAFTMLAPTDWMVVRKLETNKDVPAEVAAYRAAVRMAAEENQSALNAAADIEAFVNVATRLEWPEPLNKGML